MISQISNMPRAVPVDSIHRPPCLLFGHSEKANHKIKTNRDILDLSNTEKSPDFGDISNFYHTVPLKSWLIIYQDRFGEVAQDLFSFDNHDFYRRFAISEPKIEQVKNNQGFEQALEAGNSGKYQIIVVVGDSKLRDELSYENPQFAYEMFWAEGFINKKVHESDAFSVFNRIAIKIGCNLWSV